MKVILSTTQPDIDSEMEPHFGRGAYFIIVDSETPGWRAVPNPSYSSANGAGFQAAQYIASERAAVVISGQFGDDAVNVLKESGVALYQVDTCHTGREAIEQWKAGALLVI